MNLKRIMPVLAIACVCAVGRADAASDPLMMPQPATDLLHAFPREASVAVPNDEVRDVVNAFTRFQLDQAGKRVMDDTRVMTGQERYRNNVLYYMNVRRSWYIVSHRYKNDSYARVVLDRLYNDYKEFFTEHGTVSQDNQLDYTQQIIDILSHNMADVDNNELRTYMNEMVIFSLNEAMKDGNNRVKPVSDSVASGDAPQAGYHTRVVDLRKAINEPIQTGDMVEESK